VAKVIAIRDKKNPKGLFIIKIEKLTVLSFPI
jgi:hypothetical protein